MDVVCVTKVTEVTEVTEGSPEHGGFDDRRDLTAPCRVQTPSSCRDAALRPWQSRRKATPGGAATIMLISDSYAGLSMSGWPRTVFVACAFQSRRWLQRHRRWQQ